MKLTILGCHGPFPEKDAACSGYLFENGNDRLLVECGSGVLSKLLTHIDPASLGAVALSHLHADHMSDMPTLGYYLQFKQLFQPPAPVLTVFAPGSPAAERGLLSSPYFNLTTVYDNFTANVGSLALRMSKASHSLETYAMRLSAGGADVFYTADTRLNDEIIAAASGCRLLLCDAVLPERLKTPSTPHMSALEAGKLAAASGCRTLVLTHLCPFVDGQEIQREAASVFEHAVLAAPGAVYTL